MSENRGIVRGMDFLISWAKGHPIAYPLVLAILGGGISVFSTNIKRAITVWPRNAAETFSKNTARNRLQLLKELHNNAYTLLLHLVMEGLGILTGIFIWTVIFWRV